MRANFNGIAICIQSLCPVTHTNTLLSSALGQIGNNSGLIRPTPRLWYTERLARRCCRSSRRLNDPDVTSGRGAIYLLFYFHFLNSAHGEGRLWRLFSVFKPNTAIKSISDSSLCSGRISKAVFLLQQHLRLREALPNPREGPFCTRKERYHFHAQKSRRI